ncbi:family 43 glycosylhydrolase [Amnibacterium setariae]|uniref:Arabinan endo-1,5-alpha-L-arabinosidase n=1 Tax=Amnibacterium setariae TaxID=2306585 RepID=A0A3A1U1U2_9MICO|nr:family 43 glycosylhydrolase [Amnibacterium setariae]RIX27787.1 arabinan endo-1,5-alpha-L-arabinosidase [Amnibacterium setariae]
MSWEVLVRRVAPLVIALALVAGLLPAAPASAAPAAGAAADQRSASPGTFRNPLDLRLPDGSRAENCADPDVARGTGGDRHWYLYCTTDAIDAGERGPDGAPVQHLLPTYRSTDLVHWRYAGDAFAKVPGWVAPDAGLWAPEIRHANGRWYLYYTAPETALPGGGSAIGVATAPSPTGPWTDSGRPVVAPADNPTSPGNRRWTYDPEVLTEGGTAWIYFGSYNGGLFVRRLSADGLSTSASSERRIAIANRYEGTNVVRHDGWYYLLASATNCCNGALTGYSVFAARSRSPLGPFRDADGRSILAAKVGGTPVLSRNGNRWIGTGHESAFTDAAGQGWLAYHAVDRTDPLVPGTETYTKRAVLLDRLDWRHGWPVVRGGRGPSDGAQPAPAAQPGQRRVPPVRFVDAPRPGRAIPALSDDFRGSRLASRWSWVRPPVAGGYSVAGGALRFATQAADLHPPATPLASVLTERAPRGDFVVEAKLRTTVPDTGDSYNYAQGGVLVYGGDGRYVKLAVSSIYETRQTEWGVQDSAQPAGRPTYGNGVVGPVGRTWTWLRIIRHGDRYTAATSVDGRRWRTGGTWTTDLGAAPRIGLVSMGAAGFTTVVDAVRVSRLR